MTKKTKKAIVDINGSSAQMPDYPFRRNYINWKKICDRVTSEQMASTGSKYAAKDRATYPRSLYLQLKNHVTDLYIRAESTNTGNDGLFEVLDSINEIVTSKEYFTLDDLESLQEFKEAIEGIEGDEKLNPRNTIFTRPAAWKIKGKPKEGSRAKNGIEITDDEPITIYGHYRDKYFEDKYGVEEKKGWWNLSPNTANPPLAQAIYGEGDLVIVGLLTIITDAIKEIKGTSIPNIKLNVQRNAGSLAKIPSVRKQVQALLRRSDLFAGGKPKLRQMATIIQGMDFVVGAKSFGARAAKPQLIIQYVGKLPDLASPIETFSFKTLGPNAMGSLILSVIGKKTYKLKNGNYLDIKGRTEVPKEVKKSWIEQLWRD